MNEELRKAAERLRKHYQVIAGSAPESESPYAIKCGVRPGAIAPPTPRIIFAVGELGVDEELLSRAWLAERDSTPIDESWLRSIGFVDRGKFALSLKVNDEEACTFALSCSDFQNIPCPWEIWNELDDNTPSEGAGLPCQPETRGHVRRLAAALGIALKEPS